MNGGATSTRSPDLINCGASAGSPHAPSGCRDEMRWAVTRESEPSAAALRRVGGGESPKPSTRPWISTMENHRSSSRGTPLGPFIVTWPSFATPVRASNFAGS